MQGEVWEDVGGVLWEGEVAACAWGLVGGVSAVGEECTGVEIGVMKRMDGMKEVSGCMTGVIGSKVMEMVPS